MNWFMKLLLTYCGRREVRDLEEGILGKASLGRFDSHDPDLCLNMPDADQLVACIDNKKTSRMLPDSHQHTFTCRHAVCSTQLSV
jgi:hypothetical protein